MRNRLVVYVDIDDTLVRTVGTKRIPMPAVVGHVRVLAEGGAELYAWSSGGAIYARESAHKLGIDECFVAFLPKPHVLIDDQPPAEWRRLVYVYPADAPSRSLNDLIAAYERVAAPTDR